MARGSGSPARRRAAAASVVLAPLLLLAGLPASAAAAPAPAAAGSTAAGVYVSLGDSFASGEANPPFRQDDPDCSRSDAAWPSLVAATVSLRLVQLACSGASTRDLLKGRKDRPAQLTELAAVRPAPDLVTVTVGGNDAGFAATMAQCFLGDCWDLGGLKVSQWLVRYHLPRTLSGTYAAILRAAPGSRLVVVGYPRLFPRSQSAVVGCRWLSSTERTQLNRTADLLDRVARRAAARAGAEYVDVRRALRGHELCSKDPWVYPVGEDLKVKYMAHPTRKGQEAMAAVVADALR